MSRFTPIRSGWLRLSALLAVLLQVATPALPDDLQLDQPLRLQVIANDPDIDANFDRVAQVIAAANAEDLDDFITAFVPSRRPAIRREAGLFFVQHDLAVELSDCQVLSCSEDTAEVAVNYLATLDTGDVRVLALLILRRSGDDWHIESEAVVRRTVVKAGCATGTCGGAEPVVGGFCIGGRCQVQ